MMRAWLFVVAVGCTHERTITEAHEVAGETVEVAGQYGQAVTAVAVATPGGITFYDKRTGGLVPMHEISKVTDVSHGRGAVEGLGIGGGVGVLTGAVIGLASGDDACEPGQDCVFAFSAGEKAVLGGVVLGAIGGGLGLIVGAMKGSATIYTRSSQPAVRLIGPPGSVGGVTFAF